MNLEARIQACEREGIMDDNGYSPHHCFFRSEYKKEDWDEEWNIEPIRFMTHEKIHHQGGGRALDVYYKQRALSRYKGKHREVLEKILRKKL